MERRDYMRDYMRAYRAQNGQRLNRFERGRRRVIFKFDAQELSPAAVLALVECLAKDPPTHHGDDRLRRLCELYDRFAREAVSPVDQGAGFAGQLEELPTALAKFRI